MQSDYAKFKDLEIKKIYWNDFSLNDLNTLGVRSRLLRGSILTAVVWVEMVEIASELQRKNSLDNCS